MAVTIDFTKTTAYRRGEEKGKREGTEQNKIDSAQRMLADGELSIEQIAKYADLTVEEVTNLKSKYF